MRFTTPVPTLVLLLASSAASIAEPLDVLLGQWISPDGFAKQSIERQFDGSWLSTRMWFKLDDRWKLVGTGSIYEKPKVAYWSVVTRSTDMDGIELFESELRSSGDRRFELRNTAIKSDGAVILTEEEWHFVDADHFNYTIYRINGRERTPWMEGSWVRQTEAE